MRIEHFINTRTDTDYFRITKKFACKLFTTGHTVIIAPCKVNMRHPAHLWGIIQYNGIDEGTPEQHFDRVVNSFEYYNCNNELGTYAKFFAPAAVIDANR